MKRILLILLVFKFVFTNVFADVINDVQVKKTIVLPKKQ